MKKQLTAKGKLTVIAGPMFSGKTGRLVALKHVLTGLGKTILIVKPSIDVRYSSESAIHSHDQKKAPAIVVNGEKKIAIERRILREKPDVVIFDEVQFFHKKRILGVIDTLRKKGKHVIAAGLLYDYLRKPFGATPELLGLADESMELFSVCEKCGSLAKHSERTAGSTSIVDVGASDKYIPVCQRCHVMYGGGKGAVT